MAVTRSMSGTSKRDKVTSEKITAPRDVEVTNAKSQEVDAETLQKKKEKRPKKRKRPSLLVEPSSDKYFDLDERTLALGIFLDTWKQQRLKNDPDIKFTRESYQAAMREFNSLDDYSKDSYIAEAKKRNSVQNNAVPVGTSRELPQPSDLPKPRRNKLFENDIWCKAPYIFLEALIQEHLKNDPNFRFTTTEAYYAARKEFYSLSDDDTAPYIGEAMRSYLAQRAKSLEALAESEV